MSSIQLVDNYFSTILGGGVGARVAGETEYKAKLSQTKVELELGLSLAKKTKKTP